MKWQSVILLSLLFLVSACGQTLWPSEDDVQEEVDETKIWSQPLSGQQAPAIEEASSAPIADKASAIKPSRAILTIYFDEAEVAYQRSLLKIVEAVLPHKTNARFQILGVSPDDALAEIKRTQGYILRVRQSLLDMGVPEEQIELTQAILPIAFAQIQIFIR